VSDEEKLTTSQLLEALKDGPLQFSVLHHQLGYDAYRYRKVDVACRRARKAGYIESVKKRWQLTDAGRRMLDKVRRGEVNSDMTSCMRHGTVLACSVCDTEESSLLTEAGNNADEDIDDNPLAKRVYDHGRVAGAREERASIVAWLRGLRKTGASFMVREFADAIERGDHVKKSAARKRCRCLGGSSWRCSLRECFSSVCGVPGEERDEAPRSAGSHISLREMCDNPASFGSNFVDPALRADYKRMSSS
jgi:hypothetical protein